MLHLQFLTAAGPARRKTANALATVVACVVGLAACSSGPAENLDVAAQSTSGASDSVNGVVRTPGPSGSFVSPTGNITCTLSEDNGVSCHVFEHEWTLDAPTDTDCQEDWGDNIGLTDGGVNFGCYSDIYWDLDADTLPYGSAIEVGDFDCRSERSGVSCFNSTGAGFTVAQASYDIHDQGS